MCKEGNTRECCNMQIISSFKYEISKHIFIFILLEIAHIKHYYFCDYCKII